MSKTWLKGWNRRKGALSALLIYSGLSMVMTWPLIARLGTLIPTGRGADVWVHQWTFWWIKKSLLEGRNPFYTDLLFYPNGVSLTSHNIAWFNIAIWLPLQALIGNAAAYSLIYIFVFALNGYAMYLLVRDWSGSSPAAFIGGLVYGFWPFAVSQTGHPNMIVIFWVPLALLFLKRTMEDKRKQDAVLAGVCIAMTGLVRWQLLIMAGVLLGLFIIYMSISKGSRVSRRTLALLLLSSLVAILLMAPLVAPVISTQLSRALPQDSLYGRQDADQTDLLAYIVPNGNLFLWRDVVPRLPETIRFTLHRVEFVGYLSIALALVGVMKNWRSARFWVLAALIYLVLALGPYLRLGNQVYPQIPMPARLVDDLYLIQVLREPIRFNIFLGLPLAMLAGFGVVALLQRPAFRRKPFLLVGMIGAIIVAEYWILPSRTTNIITPEWYLELAQEPEQFAVLDLPTASRGFDKWYMMYQMTHGKPLVTGHVSRLPDEANTFLKSTPFLKKLYNANVMEPSIEDISRQLETLAKAGVKYLILHKRFATAEQLASWQDWLVFKPYHEDQDLIVYRMEPVFGRDFTFIHQMTDEIGLIGVNFAPNKARQGDQILVDARWGSNEAPAGNYKACFSLANDLDGVVQLACQPVSSTLPTSQWKANEVVRSRYGLQIDPLLEAGEYKLAITLSEAASGKDLTQAISLGSVVIEALPRVYMEPTPEYPLTAQWGNLISLLGYDLQESADSLQLTLYWQALQRMDESYKVFVHLIDSGTGEIVAQNDGVPRDWTYPTNWWEQGELITDLMDFPLNDLSTDNYQLVLGLYNSESNERLPIYSAEGKLFPGDAILLSSRRR